MQKSYDKYCPKCKAWFNPFDADECPCEFNKNTQKEPMGLNAKLKEIKDKYKDEEFIPKYDQDFLVAAVPQLVEALEIAIANLKRMKEQDCTCTPEFGSATCGPCGTLKAIEEVLK